MSLTPRAGFVRVRLALACPVVAGVIVACSSDAPVPPEEELRRPAAEPPHAAPLAHGAGGQEELDLEAEALDGGDDPLVAGCIERYGTTDVDCEAVRESVGESCWDIFQPFWLTESDEPTGCHAFVEDLYKGKLYDCREVLNDKTAVCRVLDNVCFPGLTPFEGAPVKRSSARCEFGTPDPVETTYCRCPYDHGIEKVTVNNCGAAPPGSECNLRSCTVKKPDGSTEQRDCEWNPDAPGHGGGIGLSP
jgi:hypothetical protein